MVDWGGLENRCRVKLTVGSNPTPSATSRCVMVRPYAASPGRSKSLGRASGGSSDRPPGPSDPSSSVPSRAESSPRRGQIGGISEFAGFFDV